MTIQGNILPVRSLVEPLQVVMDSGAKRVLIPLSNRRDLLEIPPTSSSASTPLFYSDPRSAVLKAIDMN